MNPNAIMNQKQVKKDNQSKNVNQKLRKLSSLLNYCNYNYNVRVQITKSVQEVFRALPLAQVELLQFYEQSHLKRYIEIYYYIEKPYFPKITLFIMLPQQFPDEPPFLRITNPNPEIYGIEKQFTGLKSTNDSNSILLNSVIKTIKHWNNSRSLINTILQAQTFIKTYFPYQRKDQVQNKSNVWGNYNKSPNNNVNVNANNNNLNGGNNNANNMNVPNNNNVNYNNYMNNNNNVTGSKNNIYIYNPKPVYKPLNDGIVLSYEDVIVKGQIYYSNSKQKVLKVKVLYDKCIYNIQKLDIFKRSVKSQSNRLAYKAKQLQMIINHSTQTNFLSLIKPKDKFSENLLQLISSIRARLDKSIFIQQKFFAKQMSLQVFMKISRKNQQQKFQQIYMVKQLLEQVRQSKKANR